MLGAEDTEPGYAEGAATLVKPQRAHSYGAFPDACYDNEKCVEINIMTDTCDFAGGASGTNFYKGLVVGDGTVRSFDAYANEGSSGGMSQYYGQYTCSGSHCRRLKVTGKPSDPTERPTMTRNHDGARFFTVQHELWLESLTLENGGTTTCSESSPQQQDGSGSAIHVLPWGKVTMVSVTFKGNQCGGGTITASTETNAGYNNGATFVDLWLLGVRFESNTQNGPTGQSSTTSTEIDLSNTCDNLNSGTTRVYLMNTEISFTQMSKGGCNELGNVFNVMLSGGDSEGVAPEPSFYNKLPTTYNGVHFLNTEHNPIKSPTCGTEGLTFCENMFDRKKCEWNLAGTPYQRYELCTRVSYDYSKNKIIKFKTLTTTNQLIKNIL